MERQKSEKKLLIIGAGGFGREVKWLVERINAENRKNSQTARWELIGFIDDGIKAGTVIDGIPVLGDVAWLEKLNEKVAVVCAIGNAQTRKKTVEKLADKDWIDFPNLIDPSVMMSGRVAMGKGNLLCAGNILTVDIHIEDFTILNLDCTVGHDVEIGSYVTVYPSVNISGGVSVGSCCELGTGSHIIQGIAIQAETILGAGAVVIRDLPGHCTAVGTPAKVLKSWQ